jgi:DNA-binding MarR family transcriptional regulator
MYSAASPRSDRIDEIALALVQRYGALTRTVFARARPGVSRTEAGALRALAVRPRRVTELAAAEGISQPAATQLVNRLVARGWAEREQDPGDARAVVVRLADAGRDALEQLRGELRAAFHDEFAGLDDGDVETLAAAVAILDRVITGLGETDSTA